jgi:ribosomal protein S27AE
MLRDRFRRFSSSSPPSPFSSPVVPADRGPDPQGWHGTDGDPARGGVWDLEVDRRRDTAPASEVISSVTACPACGSSMAVEELDLVGRQARLVCGDCGLLRARRLPSLAQP